MAQSVLITGCSHGGMGDALAQEFHHQGFKVFASARNLEKTRHLEEMGIRVIKLDVLEESMIRAAVEVVQSSTGGKLDYLINNAGIEACTPILDTDQAKAKRLFDVNLWSVIAVTKAFTPLLSATNGTIVNHSSVGAKVCMPFLGIYSASKAALDQVTDAMRMELRSVGISVVILSTAGVKTRMLANREPLDIHESSIFADHKVPLEKLKNEEQTVGIQPAEFAKIIVHKLRKGSRPTNIWAGESAFPIWFILTFFPKSFVDWIIIRMTGMARFFQSQSTPH